jgi:hypothetical protein
MNRTSCLEISWPRRPRSPVSASRNGSIASQPSERVARSRSATAASASASAAAAAASSANLLVLVEDQLGGRLDVGDRGLEIAGVGVAQPVVGVGGAGRQRQDVLERRPLRGLGAGQPRDRQRVGQAAHQIGVADLGQVAAVGRRRRRVLGRRERGLPHLHRVDPGRLARGRAHHDHAAVGEQRVAVAGDRRRHRLLDQVVRVQLVGAVAAAVVDVQHVLAVGRAHLALEHVVAGVAVEGLVGAADQHVAAGEDDAVVLGQRPTALADAVGAHHRPRPGVEHQVAPRGLAERQHLEHDQPARLAERGVEEPAVVERLVGVGHRLAVDAAAGLGVVLDLDRQVAADGLDEQRVEDVVVRVLAGDLIVAGDLAPLEVVGRRVQRGQVAVAAIVDVGDPAVGLDPPAQDLLVLPGRAGLEHREQERVALDQLDQPRLAVVAVQVGEVAAQLGAGQEPAEAVERQRRGVEAGVAAAGYRLEPVQRQDVADLGLGLEPEEDVEAEQQLAAERDDVDRDAVVLRAHPLGRDQLRLGGAEQRLAAGVERVGALRQLGAGGRQPLAQHLVGAAGQGGVDISHASYLDVHDVQSTGSRRGRGRGDVATRPPCHSLQP